MIKLLLFLGVLYILYRIFWKQSISFNNNETYEDTDLIECSNCHTFVPKNECKFTSNGCICKDCQ